MAAKKNQEVFVLIKPDAVQRGIEFDIISAICPSESTDPPKRVTAIKRAVLSRQDAEFLYQEHKNKSHFNDLVDYMISGPCIYLRVSSLLESDEMVASVREVVGRCRKLWALDIRRNSVHASDSPSAAGRELSYFNKLME